MWGCRCCHLKMALGEGVVDVEALLCDQYLVILILKHYMTHLEDVEALMLELEASEEDESELHLISNARSKVGDSLLTSIEGKTSRTCLQRKY